jgi:hypothetical protein
MARLIVWLPLLLKRLDTGLSQSQILNSLKEATALDQAREFCLDLWPFIKDLPGNIALVKDALPEGDSAAHSLLTELVDEEYFYQSLFVKQCLLVGNSANDLEAPSTNPAAEELRRLMKELCCSADYADGVLAIITAELAATAVARKIAPFYEEYFRDKATSDTQKQVDEGMEWLRLHARPQTRNALLLNRAIATLEHANSGSIPYSVEIMLDAIFRLWRCPSQGVVDTDLGARRQQASDLARA